MNIQEDSSAELTQDNDEQQQQIQMVQTSQSAAKLLQTLKQHRSLNSMTSFNLGQNN